MKNVSIIIVVLIILAVIGFVYYKHSQAKKEAVKKVTTATMENSNSLMQEYFDSMGINAQLV